jgi:hypothetical protein
MQGPNNLIETSSENKEGDLWRTLIDLLEIKKENQEESTISENEQAPILSLDLPDEMWLNVLSLGQFNPREINDFRTVNRTFLLLSDEKIIWKRLLEQYFPYLGCKDPISSERDPKAVFKAEYEKFQQSYAHKLDMRSLLSVLTQDIQSIDFTQTPKPLAEDMKQWLAYLGAAHGNSFALEKIFNHPHAVHEKAVAYIIAKSNEYLPPILQDLDEAEFTQEAYLDALKYAIIANEDRIAEKILDEFRIDDTKIVRDYFELAAENASLSCMMLLATKFRPNISPHCKGKALLLAAQQDDLPTVEMLLEMTRDLMVCVQHWELALLSTIENGKSNFAALILEKVQEKHFFVGQIRKALSRCLPAAVQQENLPIINQLIAIEQHDIDEDCVVQAMKIATSNNHLQILQMLTPFSVLHLKEEQILELLKYAMHTPGCDNLAATQVIVDVIKASKPGILDAAVISLKGFNPFMVEQFENIFWGKEEFSSSDPIIFPLIEKDEEEDNESDVIDDNKGVKRKYTNEKVKQDQENNIENEKSVPPEIKKEESPSCSTVSKKRRHR